MPRLMPCLRVRRIALLALGAFFVVLFTLPILQERSVSSVIDNNVQTNKELKKIIIAKSLDVPSVKPETLQDLVNGVLNKSWIDPLIYINNSFNDLNVTETDKLKIENEILKAQITSREKIISFLSQQIINEENFEYIHNPSNACAGRETEVLFAVPSKPENFEYRSKVRLSERGKYAGVQGNKARLLFFVGRDADSSAAMQDKLDDEMLTHQDIVQVDLKDTYRNIRLKTMSMLHWANTFCSRAKFFIRTDDDVKVNVTKVISVMRAKQGLGLRHFVMGEIKAGWEPIRKSDNKYYLSTKEYPGSTLPPFAIGGLLGFPMETATLLYQCALRLEPLWLDDVFLTGLCAPKMGVPLLSDEDFRFKHWDW